MPYRVEEKLMSEGFRIYPSQSKMIKQVLKLDTEYVFENKSHFIRSAISYFLRESPVVKKIKENKK